MIRSFQKYFQLFGLVFKHGTLQHSGENFNEKRAVELRSLEAFIPPGRADNPDRGTTSVLRAQAAFFKNSLTTKGGHLITNNLAYIRIPKSASTSMSKAMLENRYPALQQKNLTDKQINSLTDVNLETGASQMLSYFTIVRNPFSRLVSVYRDFFENSNPVFQDYMFGILPQSLSFSEFAERIVVIPDHLHEPHVRPQHSFLKFYEHRKLPVSIFKLEETEKINQFLQPHGLQLPHVNKSQVPYDYREYYTPHLLVQVSEMYRKDIEKFGYEKAYRELHDFIDAKA